MTATNLKCSQRNADLYFEEVQLFVKRSLSEYNDILEHRGSRFSGKDIFDFVCGTVNFGAAEMMALNSSLLQRLRHIR